MKKLKLNKKTTLKLHKELWLWLADNPKKRKQHWPGWKRKDILKANHNCFACEYAIQQFGHKETIIYGPGGYCKYCPLDWELKEPEDSNYRYACDESYYQLWYSSGIYNPKRSELALKIAKLKPRVLKISKGF